MNKKPIIGITASYVRHHFHMEGVYVHHDYHNSVVAAGGVPIVLPFTSPEVAIDMLSLCDGLILSGGEDVDPQFYGQDPHPKLGYTSPLRDQFELEIFHLAMERKMPVLAICRGLQLVNVARGGTLLQDIPSQRPQAIKHEQDILRQKDSHWVEIEPNSILAPILGATRIRVNSLHHQGIDRLGNGLRVTARSSDGIVEAFEDPTFDFLLGVQWHPESMATCDPIMKRLFEALVSHCKVSCKKKVNQ